MEIKEWVRSFIKEQLSDSFTSEYPPEIIDKMNDFEICLAVAEFFSYIDHSGSGLEEKHKTLIGEVLARLPQDSFMKLYEEKVIFIVPTFFGASALKLDSIERENIIFVFLPVMSLSRSKDVILGEIAHELAHIHAEHLRFESPTDELEKEADKIAIAWGFKTEIQALNKEIQSIKSMGKKVSRKDKGTKGEKRVIKGDVIEKVVARHDRNSKRYHRFIIEERHGVVGTIYVPKGGKVPAEITIVPKPKNEE